MIQQKSIAEKVAIILESRGFSDIRPWSKYGIERVYWSNAPGYIELIGRSGFRVRTLTYLPHLIEAAKIALDEVLSNERE